MDEASNHRFVVGYTDDECQYQDANDVCLRSRDDRVHFPPGDDWDEMYSRLGKILRLARQYWDDQASESAR